MLDVIEVKYLVGYRLEVGFENGEKGVVDLEGYITKGGVFSRFSDISYFKQVFVNSDVGTLCWPDGVDIAPETLYSLATGKPLPSWVTEDSVVPR